MKSIHYLAFGIFLIITSLFWLPIFNIYTLIQFFIGLIIACYSYLIIEKE